MAKKIQSAGLPTSGPTTEAKPRTKVPEPATNAMMPEPMSEVVPSKPIVYEKKEGFRVGIKKGVEITMLPDTYTTVAAASKVCTSYDHFTVEAQFVGLKTVITFPKRNERAIVQLPK